ncbi:MAG TPA: DUF1684 domain-containing protein [Flavobacteriales bacterium]
MRAFLFVTAFCAALQGWAQPADGQAHRDSSAAYWSRMEAEFADSLISPLTAEDRERFTRIERFPYDPAYRVLARFSPAERPKMFKMRTSTSREPLYRPYGTLTFSLQGKDHTLTVYQNVELLEKDGYADYLFLPFTDATNGEETYGGGRYLDLRSPLGPEVELELNNAYNPYCAYNARYSCPVPPKENHLAVGVRAGVLKYHD